MPAQTHQHGLAWDSIHVSAWGGARELMRPAAAETLRQGALRYRCPVTGSFVLVTDETTLHWLARPRARLRCADCGELHLLTVMAGDADAVANGPRI
jgi:hypothetical protein